MVGGARDPNHNATDRVFGVFARKEPVLRDFLSPAFTGVLLPKLGFCPELGHFFIPPGRDFGARDTNLGPPSTYTP